MLGADLDGDAGEVGEDAVDPQAEQAGQLGPVVDRPGVHRQAAQAAPTVRVPALGPAPARHLRVVRDPQDRRRALLSGSFEQVCAELDRLAEIERQAESTQPTWRRIDA